MSGISKIIIGCLLIGGGLFFPENEAYGQDSIVPYRRSSLYSLVIKHPEFRYGNEIADVFLEIPVPEKFYDHNLSRRVLNSLKHDKKSKTEPVEISYFLKQNAIAKRLYSKWFNRDKTTGAFDMSLIAERGNYNASYFDAELAKMSLMGRARLADSGEELMENTFVLVSDIYYVDKQARASVWADWLGAVGGLADCFEGGVAAVISSAGQLGKTLADNIAGFRVLVISHLYQLQYSEEILAAFYHSYYYDSKSIDENKKLQYEADDELFALKYIGSYAVDSGETSIMGVRTDSPEEMIKKVCTRAIDKSIEELQRHYDVFKVKTPLFAVEPEIIAKIGLKDGVRESAVYDVIEVREVEGRTVYKPMGEIRPVKGKIWDNRFMAMEEEADNAQLSGTTFRRISGGNFYPGMLIREKKIN